LKNRLLRLNGQVRLVALRNTRIYKCTVRGTRKYAMGSRIKTCLSLRRRNNETEEPAQGKERGDGLNV
jgi:hypothetical protein